MSGKNAQRRRRLAQPEVKSGKRNLLTSLGLRKVDYKDTASLRVFISERGKIRARHVTGLTVQQQRQVATAIKNAREMALLPYPGTGR
ncbi:30S ribosomal protein S18 [Mycobacterium sp. 4858]|uniref:30S ribosomal protein S18 n=1 Tax=Mycobacterium sp. 4858 TaxID=2057185 RepID=UPI000C85F126|nr:30S ribosomal protein S18 [Mycobacterium sp. 4858]